ncbi:MAG: ComF family protein [Alphaproteobacteria bacterium]|nr:ComF family protein [Alphaproteobacteria bacterium]
MTFVAQVRAAGHLVLNALMPPQCLACGASVDRHGGVCAACFGRIAFITRPVCHACGVQIAAIDSDNALCGACIRERPAFRMARAVFAYQDEGRDLVLQLKHADRTDMARHLSGWMAREGGSIIGATDVIVPVPMHWTRLAMRTYNQAALLASALGTLSGKPVAPDALTRRRATPSQGPLGREARRRNVAGAFIARRPEAIANKTVLLVDDVLTTGATANACSRALLKAGATAVDVLCLARVPLPG